MSSAQIEAEWENSEAFRRVSSLVEGKDEWWVEYRVPYSGYRELGTGPAVGHGRFMPPEGPIRLWVHDKLGLTGKELDKAVGAIRWGIYNHGSRPEPFARPALYEARLKLSDLMDDFTLQKVAEYIATRSREIIDATQTDSGMLADQIYLVHKRVE
jgi:hypothetical protein